jgi:hypothetical protein
VPELSYFLNQPRMRKARERGSTHVRTSHFMSRADRTYGRRTFGGPFDMGLAGLIVRHDHVGDSTTRRVLLCPEGPKDDARDGRAPAFAAAPTAAAIVVGRSGSCHVEAPGAASHVITSAASHSQVRATDRTAASTPSQSMNAVTINSSAFSLTEGASTRLLGTVTCSQNVATLSPSATLTTGAVCTDHVAKQVTDLTGNLIAKTWKGEPETEAAGTPNDIRFILTGHALDAGKRAIATRSGGEKNTFQGFTGVLLPETTHLQGHLARPWP